MRDDPVIMCTVKPTKLFVVLLRMYTINKL